MAEVSFREQLLAARERSLRSRTVELEIPGYERRLWGTFRAIDDYSEVRAIVRRHQQRADAEQELHVAADTLLAACVDCYGLEDGQRHPLDVKLGLPLAGMLGLADGCDNDRQALFAVIPSTMAVMTLFAEYDQWLKGARQEAEDDLQGESGAPS